MNRLELMTNCIMLGTYSALVPSSFIFIIHLIVCIFYPETEAFTISIFTGSVLGGYISGLIFYYAGSYEHKVLMFLIYRDSSRKVFLTLVLCFLLLLLLRVETNFQTASLISLYVYYSVNLGEMRNILGEMRNIVS